MRFFRPLAVPRASASDPPLPIVAQSYPGGRREMLRRFSGRVLRCRTCSCQSAEPRAELRLVVENDEQVASANN